MFSLNATIGGLTANKNNKLQATITSKSLYEFGLHSKVPRPELERLCNPLSGGLVDIQLTYPPVLKEKVDNYMGQDVKIEVYPKYYKFLNKKTNLYNSGYYILISQIYKM